MPSSGLIILGTSYAHHLNSLPKKSTATSCEIHAWSICWSLKTAESVLERGSHKTFKSKGEKTTESDATLDFLWVIMGIGNPLQLEGNHAHQNMLIFTEKILSLGLFIVQ